MYLTFTGFETTVLKYLAKIQEITNQHSILLNDLIRIAKQSKEQLAAPPPNLPTFPLKSVDEFLKFDNLLADELISRYMVCA